MSVVPPAASAAGSLAASYAAQSHLEQREAEAARERGEVALGGADAATPMMMMRLPTHAGVAHIPSNLSDGVVVDPDVKKRTRFENEKYLRAHPELEELIQDFIVDVLEKRPADIEGAAVQFFTKEGAKRSAATQSKLQAKGGKP